MENSLQEADVAMTFSPQERRQLAMTKLCEHLELRCLSLVRMTTYVGLPAEDVRGDTRHLVTASAFQIKQKLVRSKMKHGTDI